MWGKNTPSQTRSISNAFQAGAGETTYIASDCEFSGTLTLKGSARIDGRIEGTISLAGDLVVGPSAVIKATVQANTISISGEVRGDVLAREGLELCSTARLFGNIYTQQLKIDQGAQFVGSSRLLGDAAEEPDQSASLSDKSIAALASLKDRPKLSVEKALGLDEALSEISAASDGSVDETASADSAAEKSDDSQKKSFGNDNSHKSKRR